MTTNHHKKRAASSNATPISSQDTSAGAGVPPTSVDGDHLLLRLATLARELHGQSKGAEERLCQEIADESQGQVRLILLHYGYQPAQTTSSTEHLWLSLTVEYAGRSYGILEVAPHPTRSGQSALPYQQIQVLASACALLLYSLETAVYFQREYPSPVKPAETLTPRTQEILELLCRGYQRKQIAAMLGIDPKTVGKMCSTMYSQLGVRTERQAIAAAFMLGLSSPIENLTATVKSLSVNGAHPSG
jgi:DNA-binding CsgD family transcriptional regulator